MSSQSRRPAFRRATVTFYIKFDLSMNTVSEESKEHNFTARSQLQSLKDLQLPV